MKFETKDGHTIIFNHVRSLYDPDKIVFCSDRSNGGFNLEDGEYEEFKKEYFEWLTYQNNANDHIINSLEIIARGY